MMLFRIITLVVIIAYVFHTDALLTETENRVKVCGGALSRTLYVICYDSGFNGYDKRDGLDYALVPEYPGEVFDNGVMTKRSPKFFGFLPKIKRGVYEECCLRGCTSKELLSYCAN